MMKSEIISTGLIQEKIYIIRDKKVMLDRDLAMLYGVQTKRLNEAVKRNIRRFPEDFMFQLNKNEFRNWMSQFATSSFDKMGLRKRPYVFTEQGVAMLSSVLNSEKAIAVNIQIIRVFTKLREMMDQYKELREKIEEMEKSHNANFQEIFRVIKLIIAEKRKPKEKVGFSLE